MIAAALAAAAAAWVCWGVRQPPTSRLRPRGAPGAGHSLVVLAAAAAFGIAWVGGGARWVLWLSCVAVAVFTVGRVARQHRRRRERLEREGAAARAASTVAMLLRSGQLPIAALERAARTHPILAPVASAAHVGADVSESLLAQSEVEGQEALRSVAVAWRMSERTGAPIAEAVATVAAGIRSRHEVGRHVAAELASARASARVMALLPVAAIGLGTVVGADPVGVLVAGSWGPVLVAAAVGLTAAGALWSERIVTDAEASP